MYTLLHEHSYAPTYRKTSTDTLHTYIYTHVNKIQKCNMKGYLSPPQLCSLFILSGQTKESHFCVLIPELNFYKNNSLHDWLVWWTVKLKKKAGMMINIIMLRNCMKILRFFFCSFCWRSSEIQTFGQVSEVSSILAFLLMNRRLGIETSHSILILQTSETVSIRPCLVPDLIPQIDFLLNKTDKERKLPNFSVVYDEGSIIFSKSFSDPVWYLFRCHGLAFLQRPESHWDHALQCWLRSLLSHGFWPHMN